MQSPLVEQFSNIFGHLRNLQLKCPNHPKKKIFGVVVQKEVVGQPFLQLLCQECEANNQSDLKLQDFVEFPQGFVDYLEESVQKMAHSDPEQNQQSYVHTKLLDNLKQLQIHVDEMKIYFKNLGNMINQILKEIESLKTLQSVDIVFDILEKSYQDCENYDNLKKLLSQLESFQKQNKEDQLYALSAEQYTNYQIDEFSQLNAQLTKLAEQSTPIKELKIMNYEFSSVISPDFIFASSQFQENEENEEKQENQPNSTPQFLIQGFKNPDLVRSIMEDNLQLIIFECRASQRENYWSKLIRVYIYNNQPAFEFQLFNGKRQFYGCGGGLLNSFQAERYRYGNSEDDFGGSFLRFYQTHDDNFQEGCIFCYNKHQEICLILSDLIK